MLSKLVISLPNLFHFLLDNLFHAVDVEDVTVLVVHAEVARVTEAVRVEEPGRLFWHTYVAQHATVLSKGTDFANVSRSQGSTRHRISNLAKPVPRISFVFKVTIGTVE